MLAVLLSLLACPVGVSGEREEVAEGNSPTGYMAGAKADTTMPPDVLGWRGWTYLAGAKGVESDPFAVGYDWSGLKPPSDVKSATPIDWHERIVIFTRTESEISDTWGVVHADRHAFESAALKKTQDAIAGLVDWIGFETGGRLRFVPEVTVEAEPVRAPAFDSNFALGYFGPRINGGGYEAEDKVFRGPYQGVLYILPGVESGPSEPGTINGSPATAVYEYGSGVPYAPGDFASRLHRAWLAQVDRRLAERRIKIDESASPAGVWSEATETEDLATDTLLSRIENPVAASLFAASGVVDAVMGGAFPPIKAFETVSTAVAVRSDPEHGQILQIAESGVDRNGGFALPRRADGQPIALVSKTPTLSFEAKSSSRDPIGVTVYGQGNSIEFSLGRQWTQSPNARLVALPFRNDGKWQTVSLDLRLLGSGPDHDAVTRIEIGPTTSAALAGRTQTEPIELDIDNVRFVSDPASISLPVPGPNPTSDDPEERALFAAKATVSSPGLITLLADKSELVRLNAALAYTRVKDNLAQPALVNDVIDLDPAVAGAALRGLDYQGGPLALETVRRTVRWGITPLARETAARILGATKDPQYGDEIVSLIVDRSWLCRLASVEALAGVPGREAAIRRMAFIEQVDPEIKLAVTRSADPTDEYEMRKLLWSAVNEPSDLVRAESDIRLIQSPDPAFRAEGYKGVHDDSRTTRLLVLDYLLKHPAEQHRAALRLAVADRSPRVRAAALLAFAALEKGAGSDEIANVMQDRDPSVQLALLAVSKKSGIPLSDQTKHLMATSPDLRVKQALGGNK